MNRIEKSDENRKTIHAFGLAQPYSRCLQKLAGADDVSVAKYISRIMRKHLDPLLEG